MAIASHSYWRQLYNIWIQFSIRKHDKVIYARNHSHGSCENIRTNREERDPLSFPIEWARFSLCSTRCVLSLFFPHLTPQLSHSLSIFSALDRTDANVHIFIERHLFSVHFSSPVFFGFLCLSRFFRSISTHKSQWKIVRKRFIIYKLL